VFGEPTAQLAVAPLAVYANVKPASFLAQLAPRHPAKTEL
jgi:hypothetical protein